MSELRSSVGVIILAALIAAVTLGGTVALLIMQRPVPEYLIGFDGVVIYAVYAHGNLFMQARATAGAQALASHAIEAHHQLAMMAATTGAKTSDGGTNSAGVAPQ